MSVPVTFDHKGVLIEKLGGDEEAFIIANTNLPKKGPAAIYMITRLEADMYDFAKDPTLKDKDMKNFRPQPPKQDDKMSEEEYNEALSDYRQALQEWHTVQSSLKMLVPPSDSFAIKQYMVPFWKMVKATCAVKAGMFRALTRDPQEPQSGGFLGLGKKSPPQ